MPLTRVFAACLIGWSALVSGCGDGGGKTWQCQSTAGTPPDYLTEVGCLDDFLALASLPLDASIPGARSSMNHAAGSGTGWH